MKTKIRIFAYFSHPIQYFAPLFREISKDPGIDLRIYYGSTCGISERYDKGFGKKISWDIPLLDGYTYKFLHGLGKDICPTGFWLPFNPALFFEIINHRPDFVWIHGHYSSNSWMGMIASRFAQSKVLIRSESNLESTPKSHLLFLIKSFVMKFLLKYIDGVLYIGSRNKEYFQSFGVPHDRLYYLPYGVDNSFYQSKAGELFINRKLFREEFGIKGNRPVILFVGKLIPKKMPILLLEAFAETRKNVECVLLVVGDGMLMEKMKNIIEEKKIPDVIFTGFINQSKLHEAYISADLLVLPSGWDETWGLVVNEGMNFKLPVVVSDAVGCAYDLVIENHNGYIFKNGSVEELSNKLSILVGDSLLRRSFGDNSLKIIQDFSVEKNSERFIRVANSLLGV